MTTDTPQDVGSSRRPVARLIRFRIGERDLAIRMSSIAGLLAPFRLRPVSGVPRGVVGLSEWRGRLLTVLDLCGLLGAGGLEDGADACLIRLVEPYGATALRVPAPVALIRHRAPILPADPDGDLGPAHAGVAIIDGVAHDLLDPRAIVAELDREGRDASRGA
jgi:chemotaxis signal transduction protein